MPNLDESRTKHFSHFGTSTAINEDGIWEHPEQISIGNSVFLERGYHMKVQEMENGSSPTIIIGDNCWCNRYFRITAANRVELKKNVLIGPHVTLTDIMDNEGTGRIELGESCWLGANVVVKGNVRIGKGSVVGAHSVVLQDIPDYCVATGNPAAISRIYDTVSGEWVRVSKLDESNRVLANRRRHPLLSICLAPFDHPAALEQCLQSIYDQIDDCDLFEICAAECIVNPQSSVLLDRFQEQHANLTRISVTNSLTPPIVQLMNRAKGAFVMPLLQPSRFESDRLIPFLNVIHHHRTCSFIWINGNPQSPPTPIPVTQQLQGFEAFAVALSRFGAKPASLVLERTAWQRLQELDPSQEQEVSFIPWVRLLINMNPSFCLYDGSTSTGTI
jgi:acetyltransferase-like isoleucine patch superfamily enzyme